MVKVVHIGMPFSGVGNYISQSVIRADHKKFSFHLLCNLNEDISSIYDTNRLKTHHIPISRKIKPFVDFLCLIQIIKHLLIIKPQVVHCHSSKPGLLGRIATSMLGIPTFYTPHAFAFLNKRSNNSAKFYLILERVMAKFPATILACSKNEQKIAVDVLKFNIKKALLWKNCILPLDKEYNFDVSNVKKEFSIASIGRICYQKNYQMALEVMKKIKKKGYDLVLNIYGAGYYSPEKEQLKREVKQLGLEKNIKIFDHLDRATMVKKLATNIVYLSTSRYEGLPYSIMEAMSLKVPAVVTDIDGNNELILDGVNGYLINPTDVDRMVDAIIELINSDEKRIKMGEKANEIFNLEYNLENNIKKLQQLYLNHSYGHLG